jgi:hypothetical protein
VPSKRKDNFARSRVAQKRAPQPGSEAPEDRPNLARINLDAGAGRAGFKVGDRVRIDSIGMYSGQTGVIERLSSSVIPSALVRVEGGGTRQVRTIDLVAAPREKS